MHFLILEDMKVDGKLEFNTVQVHIEIKMVNGKYYIFCTLVLKPYLINNKKNSLDSIL